MAVTVADVALGARVITTLTQTILPGIASQIERKIGVANLFIEDYAPHAPEVIKDEAAISMAAYLFDRPLIPTTGFVSAFYTSGAAPILSSWHSEKSVLIRGDGEEVNSVNVPPGINTDEVNALISAAIISHAEMPNVHHTPPSTIVEGGVYHKTRLLATQTVLQTITGLSNSSYVFDDSLLSLVANTPLPAGVTAESSTKEDGSTNRWLSVPALPPARVNAIIVEVSDTVDGDPFFSSLIPWMNTWGREIVNFDASDNNKYLYLRAASNTRETISLALQYGSGDIPANLTIKWYYGVIGTAGDEVALDQTARDAAAAAQTTADGNTASKLERADIVAGTNITLTEGTGRQVTISSSGAVSSTDQTARDAAAAAQSAADAAQTTADAAASSGGGITAYQATPNDRTVAQGTRPVATQTVRVAAGQKAIIFFNATITGQANSTTNVKLLRGTTEIQTQLNETQEDVDTTHNQIVVNYLDDTPGTGSVIYNVQVTTGSFVASNLTSITLLVLVI